MSSLGAHARNSNSKCELFFFSVSLALFFGFYFSFTKNNNLHLYNFLDQLPFPQPEGSYNSQETIQMRSELYNFDTIQQYFILLIKYLTY